MDKLKISFEYGVSPLWVSIDGGFFENYSPNDLIFNFSDELINEINRINKMFQATFNKLYPPDSGFTDESQEEFDINVIQLKEAISKECTGKFEIF